MSQLLPVCKVEEVTVESLYFKVAGSAGPSTWPNVLIFKSITFSSLSIPNSQLPVMNSYKNVKFMEDAV